jgi:NitT/TauT family transport system substrate-binding protein
MPFSSSPARTRKLPHPPGFVALPLLVTALVFSACSRPAEPVASAPEPAAGPVPITVQLDWVAEPEHGGFYQAQARGWFREAGLAVTLVPGGPGAVVLPSVATGRAQIGQGESTSTLKAINEGLPILNIAAVFQSDPSALIVHADSPVRSVADLDGRAIMVRPGWPFIDYLREKKGLKLTLIPFNFSVAGFVADPNFVLQGYPIAEPYYIMQGGVPEPRFLFAEDTGYDAYAVLYANRDWAAQNPAALRALLAAYIRGWRDYLEGDPAPAHELMKQAHAPNTDAFLAYSRQKIIDLQLVTGRGGTLDQAGRITPDRFARQIALLEDLKILPADKLKPADVMSTEYLP